MKPSLKIIRRPDRKRVKQAVRLFRWDLAPREIRRANARNWLRAVALLGDRWKLAEPIKLERRA